MPIYEFVCGKCGAEFEELFRGNTEESAVCCPECGSESVRKEFSSFAVSGGGGGGDSAPPGCAGCPSSDCQMRR